MSGTYSLEDMAGYHSIYDDVTLPPITLTYLPTGQQITTKSEIPVGQALKVFDPEINAIAALVNNEILSLNEKLDISSTIEPIFFKGEYARQIFVTLSRWHCRLLQLSSFAGRLLNVATSCRMLGFQVHRHGPYS